MQGRDARWKQRIEREQALLALTWEVEDATALKELGGGRAELGDGDVELGASWCAWSCALSSARGGCTVMWASGGGVLVERVLHVDERRRWMWPWRWSSGLWPARAKRGAEMA